MQLLHRFRYYLLAIFLLLAFKPLTIIGIEIYLTHLFEKPVKIEQLDLWNQSAALSFDKPSNQGHLQVQKLYPDFEALVDYTGDVDAFSAFHPLKGEATAQAKVTLDFIDVTLSAYKATAWIDIYSRDGNWTVTGELEGLDLQELSSANSIPVEMEGLVHATLDVHTDADSFVHLRSDSVQIENNRLTNINLALASEGDKLIGEGMFDSKDVKYQGISLDYDQKTGLFNSNVNFIHLATKREFDLDLDGTYKNDAIEAKADIDSGQTHINIDDFKADINSSTVSAKWRFDTKNLGEYTILPKLIGHTFQGKLLASGDVTYANDKITATLHTNSFGGVLDLDYKEGNIGFKADKIGIEKLLHIAMIDQKISGKVTAQGSWSESSGRGNFTVPKFKIEENTLDDVHITLKQAGPTIEADISAKHAMAELKQSHTVYKNGHIQTKAKIGVEQLPDDISLAFDGNYKNSALNAKVDIRSKNMDLTLAKLHYSDTALHSYFQLTIQNKLMDLDGTTTVDGKFNYDDTFTLHAQNKEFGATIDAKLDGKKFRIDAKNIHTENIYPFLRTPVYTKGDLSFYAKGNPEQFSVALHTKRLHIQEEHAGFDDNLSMSITGNFSNNTLKLRPYISLSHLELKGGTLSVDPQKKRLDLQSTLVLKQKDRQEIVDLQAHLDMEKQLPANSITFSHVNDFFTIENISYKDSLFKAQIAAKIDALNDYPLLKEQNLYGPFVMDGDLTYKTYPELHLRTQTFGGLTTLSLIDQDITFVMNDTAAVKIGTMLHNNSLFTQGIVNAQAHYHLKKDTGKIRLAMKDATITGMDIDATLRNMQDVMGLNIFAMGKNTYTSLTGKKKEDESLSTQVNRLEIDLDIQSDNILIKDTALSTPEYLFAARGSLKRDGMINKLEVAIVDSRGCAAFKQKLKGNIASPELVSTTGATVGVLKKTPGAILDTGKKILNAGGWLIDKTASLILKPVKKDDVTLVRDSLNKSYNVLGAGKDLVVTGRCEVFYNGDVTHPANLPDSTP